MTLIRVGAFFSLKPVMTYSAYVSDINSDVTIKHSCRGSGDTKYVEIAFRGARTHARRVYSLFRFASRLLKSLFDNLVPSNY